MTYYDPRKPKPWPIRLLNKWGVENDTLATNITFAVSAIGIIITIFLYITILDGSSVEVSSEELRLIQEDEFNLQTR